MKANKILVLKNHPLSISKKFARPKGKKYPKTTFPNTHLDLLARWSDSKTIPETTNKILPTSFTIKTINHANNFTNLPMQEDPTAVTNKISTISTQNHISQIKKPSTTVNSSNQ
jgi:hypothetical protein